MATIGSRTIGYGKRGSWEAFASGAGLVMLGSQRFPKSLVSENFVLGSLAVLLGERMLAPMRRVVAKEALAQTAAACEIAPLVLRPKIGDVAALMAALNPVVKKSLESNRA